MSIPPEIFLVLGYIDYLWLSDQNLDTTVVTPFSCVIHVSAFYRSHTTELGCILPILAGPPQSGDKVQ